MADPALDNTVLICLPFGGSGASFFRSWPSRAPAGVRVLPVQLPGREGRFAEPPLTDAAQAVHDAREQVAPELPDDARVALFGHSLGAVLAYELARLLCATPAARVERLFVSGSPDPWHGRPARIAGLPDDEFVDGVQRMAGYAHPALADPEARELLLPVLRSDFAMHESYRPATARPLAVPVTAVRGRDDDLVSADAAAGWRRATTAPFDTAELDGGHMYLVDSAAAVLALIGARLGQREAR